MRILILLLISTICNAQVKTLKGVTIICKRDTSWIHSGDMDLGRVIVISEFPTDSVTNTGKRTSLIMDADSLPATIAPDIKPIPGVPRSTIERFECIPTRPIDTTKQKLIIMNDGRTIHDAPAPLVLVNGWPMYEGYYFLDTSKITRILVLTDSTATAKYGRAGSNGVVLIETTQSYFSKPIRKKNKETIYVHHVNIDAPPVKNTSVGYRTKVSAYGKNLFRITTSNDSVGHRILHSHWNGMAKYVIKRNRIGAVRKRIFYFKNNSWNDLCLFINSGLK